MRFGMLGTGVVGTTLARKLVELGHEVTMGARSAGSERAVSWAGAAGARAHAGSFRDAAAFGETVVNATAGAGSMQALEAAGAEHLAGKVLIDVSNAIAPNSGFPPTLTVCNTESLAEQIQRAFPHARVVKALNTVNADVMVNPGMIPGGHSVFIAGDDAEAKKEVAGLLQSFGWGEEDIVDLGDISNARGPEMYLALWIRMYRAMQTGHFNIRIVRES